MLVPIIFLLAFLAALTGALLSNTARSVDIARQAVLAHYADAAISDGVADFTHGLAAYVAQHGSAGPWPSGASTSAPRTACATAAGGACPFQYVITGAITDASGPADAAGDNAADATGGNAAPNLQGSVIDEQRVSARVTIDLTGPAGTLATRTRYLTYRVFETAPFAVVSGSRDITTVNGTAAAAQGDSGGSATASDTRIHVQLKCRTTIATVVPFQNDQQAPGNDGLPWGVTPSAAYETPCTVPDAPIDDFHDERWHNGDDNASGWTQ